MVPKFFVRFQDAYRAETEVQALAWHGFRMRGVETIPFYSLTSISDLDVGPDAGVAGYIGDVRAALRKLGVQEPDPMDYPEEIRSFLGRDVSKTTLVAAMSQEGVFIKPVAQKLFSGFVLTGQFGDNLKVVGLDPQTEVWSSPALEFVSEYRCFVLEREILGVRWYKGDWGVALDRRVVEAAVQAYVTAPIAYTIDFGVTKEGRTLLVEVNDGFAFGAYGLPSELYAAMLSARWEEMTSSLR